jgi:signal transduction histidine kinase
MTSRPGAAYADRVTLVTAGRRLWRDNTIRDAATALAVTVVTLLGAYGEAHPSSPSDAVLNGHHVPYTPNAAYLIVAFAGLVLAVRRRYPLTVLTLSTAAVATYSLLGYVTGAALLSPTIALYAVSVTQNLRRSLAAAVITLGAATGAMAAGSPFGPTGGGLYLLPALIAGAFLSGIAMRNHHAYVGSIQARADADAMRRIGEERLRIARELHDVVAHTMSTINVQAAAAAQVLTERPEVAAAALADIRAASREGLRELRAILNVLRQADEDDPTAPAPGLAQLDALVAGSIQAGLPVTLRVTGEVVTLPAPVDLAAFRIIQESLTNAIRHAGPAQATVSLTYDEAGLAIEVEDNGRGTGHGVKPGGHGLIGMRERAAAAGGTMRAGPAPGGGYLVTARLPVDPRPAAAQPEVTMGRLA